VSAAGGEPVLEVEGLVKHFASGHRVLGGGATVHAVDGVSFELRPGELLGLVGESGSGKSTVANCIARLVEPTAGSIRLHGRDITHLSRRAMRPLRRQLHMVFQDPYSSLNPRFTVGEIVSEPLRLHHLAGTKERDRRVVDIFERVGLRPELRFRYPHELSGGQRQRVGLARSLVLEPSVLIADEPVSALDVSVQASILNLLRELQADMGFSCLFITHDLATVEFLCDRVAVMYLGQIVEIAGRRELFAHPQHPYTQALLSAAVVPDPAVQRRRQRVVLEGDVPSPLAPPRGCRFHTRCPLHELSAPASDEEEPRLLEFAPGHRVACHLAGPGRPAPRIADASGDIVPVSG
jgi:peptide/nickel transport system ATP-binding protein